MDDDGGFLAATAEVGSALQQRELFRSTEYPVLQVGPDDRDDIGVG